jgi:hypothetical protein
MSLRLGPRLGGHDASGRVADDEDMLIRRRHLTTTCRCRTRRVWLGTERTRRGLRAPEPHATVLTEGRRHSRVYTR